LRPADRSHRSGGTRTRRDRDRRQRPDIKRIHVQYSGVDLPDDRREAADRALATHQKACPVSRSIEAAIEVMTAWAEPAGSR
jgi:uncharacterized OsmC-like protein